jgi:putative spermidine/putrescine transport system permease protein
MTFARTAFAGIIGLILALPLVVIASVSVNEKKVLSFPPQGLSVQWYGEIFADAGWRRALFNSLWVAATSASLAVAIALPLAYFLWRWRVRWAAAFFALGLAPFVLPPVITALGFLAFWATIGLYGTPATVVVSHAIFFVTLPLLMISIGFESIERAYLDAAASMGADRRTTLRTVILPLVAPYILSGYAFAFVLSLNEYIVAAMTVGFVMETLPIKIFNALRYGYTPVMAAVTVLFVLTSAVVFGLIGRYGDLPKLLGAWHGRRD